MRARYRDTHGKVADFFDSLVRDRRPRSGEAKVKPRPPTPVRGGRQLMSRAAVQVTGVRATVLSPFHYHSLAVPGGTATQPDYLTDRQVSFALGAALGCLAPCPALPSKDYRAHLAALPFLASVFQADAPRLLPPLARRLNLDDEAGLTKAVQDATGTGNLKTYFFIQEVPPGIVFRGAVFGTDPFGLASRAEGRPHREIVVRTGRHLGGLLRLEPDVAETVLLNAHTAALFGQAEGLRVATYAMHDLQLTPPLPPAEAAALVAGWRTFPTARRVTATLCVIVARHAVPRGPDGLSPLQHRILHDPAPVRVFSAPTGAGKSHAFIKAASEGRRVLFIVPTRRLAQNLAQDAADEMAQLSQPVLDAVGLWSSDERVRQQAIDPNLPPLAGRVCGRCRRWMAHASSSPRPNPLR